MKIAKVLLGLTMLVASDLAGAVESCPAFLKDATLQDGQLFVLDGRPSRWRELKQSEQLEIQPPRRISLYYIIKENDYDGRAGLIVIKSGRKLNSDEQDPALATKEVKLRRPHESDLDVGKCERPPIFNENSVSAESYDNLHDFGADPRDKKEYERDLKIMRAFHVRNYLGRNGICRDSDSVVPDAIFRLDFRNNLSQFSFDPVVVSTGLRIQFLRAFWRTLTGSAGLADQTVQLRQYRTGQGRLACLPFKLDIGVGKYFLRINDLESGYIRKLENSWQLTQ